MKMKKVLAACTAAATVFSMMPVAAMAEEEPVTIKVFSNNPDRTADQGLVEQTIFDAYMEEHPNVTIEVEALDDEAYKTKFKAYAAGSEMPDLVSVWGQPGFIDEVIDAGILAELNQDDYADYGFLNGSTDGFSKDGKLYGLPRNTDVMVVYYNAKMFEDNGWEIPTNYDEFLSLAATINEAGIIPVSIGGGDKWPLYIYMYDLMQKMDGEGLMQKTLDAIASGDYSDEIFQKAADMFRETAEAGVFEPGFETTDDATAKNLFTNGQSAMYYIGSWNMSMATSMDISDEIRENIRCFNLPIVNEGVDPTVLTAWNGGGYSVTEKSANKEAAIDLLNYMFLPENWTRIAWENGVCMSAQDFSAFATGEETEVQKQLMDMVSSSAGVSGTSIGDLGSSEYKTVCEDTSQQLAIGTITTEEFWAGLSALATK